MNGRLKSIASYILLTVVVAAAALLFQSMVQKRLWNQSTSSITEATKQGANTLTVQLKNASSSLETTASGLTAAGNLETLESRLAVFSGSDPDLYVYLSDGSVYPEGAGPDTVAFLEMLEENAFYGTIDPHRNPVSGERVFDLYVRRSLTDGSIVYVAKEFRVDEMTDSFTLSFYDGAGYSYVVDAAGEILMGDDSGTRNLLDEMNAESADAKKIAEALSNGKTGNAIVTLQDQEVFLDYRPLNAGTDWYLISVIPKASITEQATSIVRYTFLLLGIVILAILTTMLLSMRRAKKASRRMQEQANYTEHIMDSISEGIAVLAAETPHDILHVNRSALVMLGYEEGQEADFLAGHRLQDIVFPDDWGRFYMELKAVCNRKESREFECRILRPDKSCIWVAGSMEMNQDENGNPALMLTHRDVTEKKRMESAAEKRRQRERQMLITAVADLYPILATADIEKDTFRILYNSFTYEVAENVKKAEKYTDIYNALYPRMNEMTQMDFAARFAPESLHRALADGQKEIWCEAQMLMTDGQYHWVSVQAISPKDDKNYSVVLMFRAIDEQKENERKQQETLRDSLAAAQAANAAKSEFLSNMSHDIRTPLNAIIGMTEITSRHPDDPEQVADGLRKIGLSGQHLLSLVNDILDMSKIESGKITLQKEQFDFAALVAETAELIRPETTAADISLEVDTSGVSQCNVTGDKLRIRQILLNIIGNASKYTGRGGHIRIEAKDTGVIRNGMNTYVFTCSDTGIGMTEEFLEHLFDPFTRAENTTASGVAGTGLGMAITKNLVSLLGGTISAKSRLGEGSVFTVTLPLQYERPAEGEAGESAEKPAARSETPTADFTGKHILLVEDNEMNREIANYLIGETGVLIDNACDGQEAVAMFAASAEGEYDMIFMDLQMPVMNGYQATRAIRALARADAKTIPIIAMTANVFDEDVQASRQAGMNDHCGKPIDLKRVYAIMEEYMR